MNRPEYQTVDILADDFADYSSIEGKWYGTPRHSGRYPWGSGENPYQHGSEFYRQVKKMRDAGTSDDDIAKYFNMSKSEFKNKVSVSRAKEWTYNSVKAMKLKDKGYSNVEIGRMMGVGESEVRNWLKPELQERNMVIQNTANMLKEQVDKKGYIDVGAGSEFYINVSQDRLAKALYSLQEDGYVVYGNIKVPQVNNPNHNTSVMVLCPPGTTKGDVYRNRDKIQPITAFTDDGGFTYRDTIFPKSLDSNRIMIRYDEEGGSNKDGVIELRQGVDDISLGPHSHYAQVRIAVDGTHYLKGMAMYSEDKDFPPGVDVIFNTNKHVGTPKEDVFKALKIDKATGEVDQLLPFGAVIKRGGQSTYLDPNGDIVEDGVRKSLSVINKVYEENDWNDWGKTVSAQFLSKQPLPLIKRQLDLSYSEKLDEFEKISSYTNPTVKKKLLLDFAEDCDSASVYLKATGFPRQRQQVLLPLSDISEHEIYAPNFETGEEVVLIRYPHAGTFEIPRLRVNNANKAGRDILGSARDAVGIHPKVAEQLSGADFDGDTVTVIPLSSKVKINSTPPLEGLKTFNPKKEYPYYEGMEVISSSRKQTEMGKISNLITDMTLKGAPPGDIEKAVKHSMVVIDAEKHKLDYQKSYIDNDIQALKETYQRDDNHLGAATLISRARSRQDVPERKEWYPKVSTPSSPTGIDPETGEKVYAETGRTYTKTTKAGVDRKTGMVISKTTVKPAMETSTKMATHKDARDLSSGTEQEEAYANYANKLKALANRARKEYLSTGDIKVNSSAKKTYAKEAASLEERLKQAQMNSPRERQAQIIANTLYSFKVSDNPEIKNDKTLDKKVRSRCLDEARASVGAGKKKVVISPKEWEAIQAGALSATSLNKILANTDMDEIKKYAMPLQNDKTLSSSKVARIRNMNLSGFTPGDIAKALGVSVSTVHNYLDEMNVQTP